jgi:hypothetical protein
MARDSQCRSAAMTYYFDPHPGTWGLVRPRNCSRSRLALIRTGRFSHCCSLRRAKSARMARFSSSGVSPVTTFSSCPPLW